MLFVCILAIAPNARGQSSGERTSENEHLFREFAQLVYFLEEETLDIEYFLEELNILKYQKKDLNRILEVYPRKLRTAEQYPDSATQSNDIEKLSVAKEFFEKLESILLPEQCTDLKRLLFQRSILKQRRAEAFLLWSEPVIQSSLGEEKTKFNKAAVDLVMEHMQEAKVRKRETLERIYQACPSEVRSELKCLIDIAVQDVGLYAVRTDMTMSRNWTKEEYDSYEDQWLVAYVCALMRNTKLQDNFNVTKQQAEQISEIFTNRGGAMTESEMQEFREESRRLLSEKKHDEYATLQKEVSIREMKHARRAVDETFEKVFLNDQIESLKSIAKLKRLSVESAWGDDLGACISWIQYRLGDDEAKSVSKIKKLRTDFYEERHERFDTTCKKVMSLMPEKTQETFINLFGRCYDIHAEKIASFDKLRK